MHTHDLLLCAYVPFFTVFFVVFKEGFNEKIIIKKQYRRLTITVVKLRY